LLGDLADLDAERATAQLEGYGFGHSILLFTPR
jgi:hypothetical protein